MKIQSITLSSQNNSFINKKEPIIFSGLENKKINIFFMPNSAGKSLIFNSLKHLFSFDKSKFIKDTNKDFIITVNFYFEWKDYIFESNYYNKYKILHNWKEIKNFDSILRKKLWIEWESIRYNWWERNSLPSLNRFNFLDFSTIWDNEKTNKISFIDSRKDGFSKKFILAYILWADINWLLFNLITEYERKKDFIEKYKKRFDKYFTENEQLSLKNNNIENLFEELEGNRVIFWDISIAIKELQKLYEEYIEEIGFSQNEDLDFLAKEIKKLLQERSELQKEIQKIKNKINTDTFWEKSSFDLPILNGKKLQEFEIYKQYLKDLENNFDEMKIENFMQTNIEPVILNFKNFIQKIYIIFIKKAIEKGIILDLQFQENSIIFNEKELNIEAFFQTSEWIRKTLRILTFMGLHIYSQKNQTKCLEYSFYDSFIENIDSIHREALFETLFDFIEQENLDLPNMFFFITRIEKDGNEKSIIDLKDKYRKYINLIEDNWIKDWQ